MLDTRIKLAQQPGHYGLIHEIEASNIDERNMMVRCKWADGNRKDGVGDVTEIAGIICDRHRANPAVFFNHAKEIVLPIAKTEDEKGQYTVFLDPVAREAWADIYFYQGSGAHAKASAEIFDMVVKGFLRGTSFAYQILRAVDMPYEYSTMTPQGKHLLSVMMTEISIVPLPCNADTVITKQ